MKTLTTIGLSGLARSGKDTFCELAIEHFKQKGLNAKRFALADRLKARVREDLKSLCGIDVLNCSPADKELVRDYLVAVGKIKRFQTQGRYWTQQVEEEIIRHSDLDIAIITDIRYDFFEKDEVYWVKEKMSGKLIHISRYVWNMGEKVFIKPPNKDEEENDPKVKDKADDAVQWGTTSETKILIGVMEKSLAKIGLC